MHPNQQLSIPGPGFICYYAFFMQHWHTTCRPPVSFEIFFEARLDLWPPWHRLWCLFSAQRASFPPDLYCLFKVKALSPAFFLRKSQPPDTWHYNTAASFLEVQCLRLSLSPKLLHNSLLSFHINVLSHCGLSLSCCYPSLSCNIQHMPKVVGVIRCEKWFIFPSYNVFRDPFALFSDKYVQWLNNRLTFKKTLSPPLTGQKSASL